MEVKPYIILNMSRKHVNYEEDKNKVPMNKPYNIQNTNICNGIFHISFFKALLKNEGETTRIRFLHVVGGTRVSSISKSNCLSLYI